MFGCHNCGHSPHGNEIYEESECARCRAAQDPAPLSGYGKDMALHPDRIAAPPAEEEDYPDGKIGEHYCREDLAAAVSQTAKIILRLKTRSHSAWRILEMKINRPELSYSQLAEIFACRKQNIQYHLHKILSDCPELGFVLRGRHRRQSRPRRHGQEKIGIAGDSSRTSETQ